VLELLAGTASLGRSTQLQLSHGETLVAIGGALSDLGRRAEAAQKTRQGLAILRKLAGSADGSTQALTRIAEALLTARPAEFQDPGAALALLEKSLAWHAADPSASLLHARALRKLGRESEALSTAAAALAQLPAADPKRVYTSVDIRRRIETFLNAR
jgi:hypothetical protein